MRRRQDRISANNNFRYIRSLAWRSIRSSRMRNVFVILTIILSAGLLMGITLSVLGVRTEVERQVAKMQHIIYSGLDEEGLREMAQDERTSYVLGMKMGQSVEIDGNIVQPAAFTASPLKAEGTQIETVIPTEGKMPAAFNEVMISDSYCDQAGLAVKPGDTVTFTWLDKTAESYVVSGLFHVDGPQPLYAVYFSEDYARTGSQLKDIDWQAAVCFHDADQMTQNGFEDMAYAFGAEYGVDRKDMNINGQFLRILPGNDMELQETVIIAAVGIGLLFVSVLVVYSVFYLSVVGRIRQFGQLRTIGMTKRQIRRMVRTEGLILSAAGVPAGLLIGGTAAYFIRPGGWSWTHTLVTGAAVIAAEMITVLISVRRPAKTASSVSPVEAAKYSGYNVRAEKKRGEKCAGRATEKHTKKLARKITPVSLAVMSSARNRKRSVLTLLSLGVGGVLYMIAAVYVSSTSLEGYARTGEFQYGEFLFNYSYNVTQTAEHGQTDLQLEHPMDENLIRQIRAVDGVEDVRTIESLEVAWETDGDADTEANVQPFIRERESELQELNDMKGSFSYDEMLKNDEILFVCGGAWEEAYGWSFEPGDKVTMSWYDGKEIESRTFTIAGALEKGNLDQEPGDTYADFLIPEEILDEMTKGINLTECLIVKTDPQKEKQIDSFLGEIASEYPYLSYNTLTEHMQEVRSMFVPFFAMMVGLSAFIIGFALINLVNTMVTGILTRDHEFAILQSVGMTRTQLSGMLRTEGTLLAAGNIAVTLAAGTALGYVMIEILRYFGADYMHFVFPVWFFFGYAAFIVLVPILITEYMVRRFRKYTLVERLREE